MDSSQSTLPKSLADEKDETAALAPSPEKQSVGGASSPGDAPSAPQAPHDQNDSGLGVSTVFIFCCLIVMFFLPWGNRPILKKPGSSPGGALPPEQPSELCPQAQALLPVRHAELAKKLESVYATDDYKLRAYKALGGAIKIPTEVYDDLGPLGIDTRWDVFARFHDYLEKAFPNVFSTLEVTKVNTYGIVLRWPGSDPFLLPVLTTAHQDVVPVDNSSAKDWVHPPYSGYYDGKWIWGRGSCDDKSDLVAQLHAINALVEAGFKPKRSFVWAFGFDEEASGLEGAHHLARYLEREYGLDSFALLLDEGGDSYGRPYGDDVIFATPYLAEKGYIDVRIEVTAKGGHSSVPPPHTAIGVLSAMIVALEDHPHEAQLIRGGSPYNSTMCAATYGPTFPEDLRQLAFKAAAQTPDTDEGDDPEDDVHRMWDEWTARTEARRARDAVRKAWRAGQRAKVLARKKRYQRSMTMRESIQMGNVDWNEDWRDLKEEWRLIKEEGPDIIAEFKDMGVAVKLTFKEGINFFNPFSWFKKGRQRRARDVDTLEELKDALIETYPRYNAILRTTQAVDLVSGGVKVNALPELAAAVVNHRIAQHESPVDVQAHIKHVLFPVAEHFNLTMDAFGYWEPAGDGSGGHVKLTDAWDASLEPSPVTPTGPEDPYQIFAGTIKATLESAEGYNATGVVVAPQLILGNTDTQYYWDLTKSIFRYSHLSNEDLYNDLHTVNEAVRGEAWIQSIRFYTQFILNCDEHLKVGNF
ncbi:hypothetical protein BD310DRAFT_921838 [Dichomitus squalens]|uniref:Peptidase M20 dimerisation domain-containing protein n=1 Tax=Dichomitus squalens TaxID=114155 RepID=A0A4Q9Q1B6_9APHY|nr:hypothetical protein BD310DRAFT_921838 [Dichomitus squalens]